MSAVVLSIQNNPNLFIFWCEGCKCCHYFDDSPGRWKFNRDMVKPTVSPSLLLHPSKDTPRCHIFITDGKIKYLGDCTHELAGQTVDMIPPP